MPTATKEKKASKKAKKSDAAKKAKKITAKGAIHMALLLDESGSMGGNEKAVIDGTNEFVGTLRGEKNADRTKVTLAMFDDRAGQPRTRFHRKAVALGDFADLKDGDYRPTGMTPLYDAIADVIGKIDSAKKKKDKALVVIFTDGYENASKEFDNAKIKALIDSKEKEGFTFIYLGANVDAKAEGTSLGLAAQGQSYAFTSTARGTKSALRTSSGMAQSYMASGGQVSASQLHDQFGDEIAEDGSVVKDAAPWTPEKEDEDDDEDKGLWTPGSTPPSRSATSTDKARSVLRDE